MLCLKGRSMRGLKICSVHLILLLTWTQLVSAQALDDFTAEYDVLYGNIKLGKGVYTLRHLQNDTYNFQFISNMRFLIFSDKRRVDVDFNYADNQVLPIRYTHKRSGTGVDYIDVVTYDKNTNKIHSVHKGEVYQQEYDELIRDGLSAQLQLMLDLKRGLKTPSYKILEMNRVKERYFEFVKEETITLDEKEYRCVVYQVVRDKKKRRTVMWFSIDNNFQPVKMIHFAKDKKKFNAKLTFYGA